MQISLSSIPLHNIGGKMMGQCPSCQADHPTLEMTKNNGNLHGFCSACGLVLTDAMREIIKEVPQKRASTLGEVIIDADQFRGLDLPEKKQIIAPWLSEMTITLIAGWRGVGKTWLAMGLCDAITRGQNFGPWETANSVSCVYIDAEMVPADFRERLMVLTTSAPRKVPLYIYSDCHANSLGLPRANLINRRWREVLKDWAISNRVKLIVLDNIASLAAGIDENTKRDWDPINQWLLDLRFAGIATVLLHHTNKEGGQRGTSAREDNIDNSITLAHPFDYSAEEGARFVLKFKKSRVRNRDLSKIADTEFRLEEVDGRLQWTWGSVKRQLQNEALKMIDEGMKQQEIADALQISKGYMSKLKSAAIRDGYLTDKGKLTQTGFAMVNKIASDEETF